VEKPAFRSLIGKYRCLVVADGFYEWTVGPDGKKQPIHFRLREAGPFGFAGSLDVQDRRPGRVGRELHDHHDEPERAWWLRCMTGCP
jgi:putative SOS response-associated peptidase YedK